MCEIIFGRSFEVRFASASTGTTNGDGDTWDSFGGLPDMYGEITVDDALVLTTSTADDALSATWNVAEDVIITSTPVCVVVVNEDAFSDDEMDSACWNGLDAVVSLVRGGGYTGPLYYDLVDVDVEVTPNF